MWRHVKSCKTCETTNLFNMCFLGASWGAPGGPPAGSLGCPRGHWKNRVGSQLRYYALLGAPSHPPPKTWKYIEICAFIMCISYVHRYVQKNMCGSNWLWTQLIMNPIDYEFSVLFLTFRTSPATQIYYYYYYSKALGNQRNPAATQLRSPLKGYHQCYP